MSIRRYLYAIEFLLITVILAVTPSAVFAQDKSGVKPQVISLPSGPGSLEGLGENFEPNLSTGTTSYPVKFTAAPGRIGFQPELALNYDGGNANGPYTFTYTQFDATTPAVVPMQNPPVALTNRDADGLPDLVYTPEDGQHRFYLNRGYGRWQVEPGLPQNSPAERLSNPNVRMADMNGDGRVDLLVKASGTGNAPLYYYRNQPGVDWEKDERIDFGPAPAFDLNDPNVQLMDVNNDHRIDVVLTSSGRLKIWLAREGAWSQTADFDVPAPAAGDAASFADPKFKDANGNLHQKGQTRYQWDAHNQLTAVNDDITQSSFVYDATGQRVKQIVRQGDAVTTTLYAGQYAEIRGNELILYVFDEQNRVAQVAKPLDRSHLMQGFSDPVPATPAAGERHWYVADHLGGTNLLLDAQGNIAAEVAYYPFGLTRYEQNGAQVHYRFTGQEQDASGLLYYNARYYEPVTGRFISVDPLFVENPLKGLKNPQLLNLYAYALNNPGRYTDPDGTEPEVLSEASNKSLRIIAGGFEKEQAKYGYDSEKLLRNPRLSPEMVWQLRTTMSIYHVDESLMTEGDTSAGPDWTTARVVRGFDAADRGSIYDLGLGVDVQVFDKQGRYLDPSSEQGQKDYATFIKDAKSQGFTASLVTPEEGQSYIRLQYTPNYPDFKGVNGKLMTSHEVNYARRQTGWHMQDLRKYVWKVAHGSYWRLRYAMNNPIRTK